MCRCVSTRVMLCDAHEDGAVSINTCVFGRAARCVDAGMLEQDETEGSVCGVCLCVSLCVSGRCFYDLKTTKKQYVFKGVCYCSFTNAYHTISS